MRLFGRKRTWQDYWRLEVYHHKVPAGYEDRPIWQRHPTGGWTFFLCERDGSIAFPPNHIDGVRPENLPLSPYYDDAATAFLEGEATAIRLYARTGGDIPFCECPARGWHQPGARRILYFSGDDSSGNTTPGGDGLWVFR